MTIGLSWDWSRKMIGTAVEKLLRCAIVAGSGADCKAFSPIGGVWLWVGICQISRLNRYLLAGHLGCEKR